MRQSISGRILAIGLKPRDRLPFTARHWKVYAQDSETADPRLDLERTIWQFTDFFPLRSAVVNPELNPLRRDLRCKRDQPSIRIIP
jgi:hypothetical protein